MIEEMRVVSWNVNGVRARWPRLIELLTCERPDVVCLQETRCPAGRFPHERLREMGYQSRHSAGAHKAGGVAILVRDDHRVTDRNSELDHHREIAEGRWLEITTEGITIGSVYVPAGAGRDEADDHNKLAFLEAVARQAYDEHSHPLLIAGDFNVAPTDQDIYEPAWFEGSYQTGAAERADLRAILDEGELVDVYRRLHPDEHGYTCWDQREGHYAARLRPAHRPDPRQPGPHAVRQRVRGQPHLPQRLPPLQPRAAERRALRPRGLRALHVRREESYCLPLEGAGDAHGPRSHGGGRGPLAQLVRHGRRPVTAGGRATAAWRSSRRRLP